MKSIPVRVVDKKLVYSPISFHRFVEDNNGKDCDLVLRERPRSMSQLGMYRAWLKEVSAHTGNDEEELHEFLLEKLAPKKVIAIQGPKGVVEIVKGKRTSAGHALSMSKLEMSEYMEKAAALTNYPLPTREELEAMGYTLNY